MTKETKTQQPLAKFKLKGVSASVFQNTSSEGRTFFKVAVQRSYADGDNGFKTTNSYSRDDLPLLAEVVIAAWRDILKRESGTATEKKRESEASAHE